MLVCYGCSVTSGNRALIGISIESKANTLDGCVSCGCRLNGELQPGDPERWWLAFGVLVEDSDPQQFTIAPVNHCGQGPFEAVQPDFERVVGFPYAVVDLVTVTDVQSSDEVTLNLKLKHRKLAGIGPDGPPTYTHTEHDRAYAFQNEADIILPLLGYSGSDPADTSVHEVLVRLRATLLEVQPPTSYGGIRVRTDVPGAEVMLDGEFVGRSIHDPPLLLANVPVGTTEVRVRDHSGREASRRVTVISGEIQDITVDVLKFAQNGGGLPGLAPIGNNPQGFQEFWRTADSAMVVKIPAGEFLMGNAEGEAHERPPHPVYLSAFLIDKTEVTWRQFRKFVQATGTSPPPEPLWGTPDNHPASLVSWPEAQAYCEWVGGRLPTEAEWEKAARGSDGRTYPWGDAWDPTRCNAISGGRHRLESAGSFPGCSSPYGVLDMAGSNWEWVRDWYQPDYYAESVSLDPKGPVEGSSNVVRGGGWMTQPNWLRASYRFRLPPRSRRPDLGFRCAHEVPDQ